MRLEGSAQAATRVGVVRVEERKHVDINLETLKSEILDYLSIRLRRVSKPFRRARGPASHQLGHRALPDYRMFLEVATKPARSSSSSPPANSMKTRSKRPSRNSKTADLTATNNAIGTAHRARRSHIGSACSLEIAFDYNSHLYVYEARPDWYEDFLEACDEITLLPVTDDRELGADGLGGFYSNN